MSFDVAIKITSEADLKALGLSAEATKRLSEELKQTKIASTAVAAVPIAQEFGKTAAAALPVAANLQNLKEKAQGLPTALTMIGTQLAGIGPASSVAAQGLNTLLTTGFNPVAVGMTLFAGALAFTIHQMEKAREEAELLAERGLAKIQQATENLKLDQAFRQQIKVLESLDPEIDAIKQKYEEVGIAAQKNGADQDTLARISRVSALEQKKLLDGRLDAMAKEQQAIQAQISAADFRIAKIGQSGDALLQLNLAEQLHNNSINEALQKHSALAAALDKQAVAEANLQRAQNFVQTGRQGLVDFQNLTGVTLDFEKQQAGAKLADQFSAVFETFKNDPRAAGQLSSAFGHVVSEGVRIGVPDLPELLAEKLGSSNFERLRATLGDDLKSALDSTAQAGQQWGESFAAAAKNYNASAAEVGVRMDDLAAKAREFENSVTRDLAMALDVSQPLSAVQSVQAQLNAIPDVTYKQVIVQTFASGSPVMDFSTYFSSYVPAQLAGISGLSPEVAVRIPDLSLRLREIADLQEQIHSLQSEMGGEGFDALGKWNRGQIFRQIQGLSPRLEDLRFQLSADVAATGQRQGQSSGGGGGGSPIIIININGALTQEVLDRSLLPTFEAAIKEATGKDVSYQVLN